MTVYLVREVGGFDNIAGTVLACRRVKRVQVLVSSEHWFNTYPNKHAALDVVLAHGRGEVLRVTETADANFVDIELLLRLKG